MEIGKTRNLEKTLCPGGSCFHTISHVDITVHGKCYFLKFTSIKHINNFNADTLDLNSTCLDSNCKCCFTVDDRAVIQSGYLLKF